ncbi:MAG TPA: hypothetical protein VM536_03390, partial [Chloroflexia bacterium]|nr:hypothetical protein [Chloroflexia bacterium]
MNPHRIFALVVLPGVLGLLLLVAAVIGRDARPVAARSDQPPAAVAAQVPRVPSSHVLFLVGSRPAPTVLPAPLAA